MVRQLGTSKNSNYFLSSRSWSEAKTTPAGAARRESEANNHRAENRSLLELNEDRRGRPTGTELIYRTYGTPVLQEQKRVTQKSGKKCIFSGAQLIIALTCLCLFACGSEPPDQQPPFSSSESSLAVSSSSAPPQYNLQSLLPCSFCDVEGLSGPLVVINHLHYQAKLVEILGEDIEESNLEQYTQRIDRFAGKSLFFEDEFAQQRMNIATQTFHETAEQISSKIKAVDCSQLDAMDCSTQFIRDFVEPLYERDLSDAEVVFYQNIFVDAVSTDDDGQKRAITATLSSPHFLFRKEATDD